MARRLSLQVERRHRLLEQARLLVERHERRAAEALGYSRKDYLQKDYLTLYAEDRRRRGEPPGNMLFASPKKK